MFTTPPTASAPYTADAESDSTSTRSTAANGIVFRSNAFEATLTAEGTVRRPLISISVESTPSPRNSANCAPPCRNVSLKRYGACGTNRSRSVTLTAPTSSIRARSITSTGVASLPVTLSREPVTTISSNSTRMRSLSPGSPAATEFAQATRTSPNTAPHFFEIDKVAITEVPLSFLGLTTADAYRRLHIGQLTTWPGKNQHYNV